MSNLPMKKCDGTSAFFKMADCMVQIFVDEFLLLL